MLTWIGAGEVAAIASRAFRKCHSVTASTHHNIKNMSGEAEIAQAIQRARYNEAVIVTCQEESRGLSGSEATTTPEICLVACLDKDNGGVMWQNAALSHRDEADEDDDVGIVRHLRTKRWALPMLNDRRRNELYSQAIRKACRQTVTKRSVPAIQENGHGDDAIRILDIGTGTGLLAMMGAKFTSDAINELPLSTSQNKKMNVRVTSVEMASAAARLARMTVDSNELSDAIAVVEFHSMDPDFVLDDSRFTDSSPKLANSNEDDSVVKADICTSELLESGLLGEGVLPSLRDAWRRHLKPDAVVVPQRARVIAVLVEGLPLDATIGDRGGSLNSATAFVGPNIDAFSKVSHGVRLSTSAHGDSMLLGDALVPIHADALLGENSERKLRPLSDPTQVLDFDFTSERAIPPECGRSVARDVVPTAEGTVNGILFWWELELVDGGEYSTEPRAFANDKSQYEWQDHWQQCLFIFGHETRVKVSIGETVELTSRHDDKSISFSIAQAARDRPNQRRKLNENGNQSVPSVTNKLVSPFRALQLNASCRTRTYSESIQYCLNAKGGLQSPVLDLSDFGLCGLIAAQLGARSVTSLESSSGNVPMTAAMVAQLGNGLPKSGAVYQVIQAQAEHIMVGHIAGGSPAEIVVAEPYYEVLEGWHLQEALNFYYLVQSMKRRGVISPTALCVPSSCSVMARVVQFDDFHGAYSRVGDENEEIQPIVDRTLPSMLRLRCALFQLKKLFKKVPTQSKENLEKNALGRGEGGKQRTDRTTTEDDERDATSQPDAAPYVSNEFNRQILRRRPAGTRARIAGVYRLPAETSKGRAEVVATTDAGAPDCISHSFIVFHCRAKRSFARRWSR